MKKLEKMKYLQRGYWNSNRKAAVSWQCPAVMGQIVNRDKECERTVTFFRKNCDFLSEKLFKIYKMCYNIKLSQRENQR